MNKAYRLIWNRAREAWVVASEKVLARGCAPARAVGALCAAALLSSSGTALALPAGGQIAAGQAVISSPSASQMQITQSSNRAVINWNSFGIGAGEAVNISQPSSQSALLNRVIGNSGSGIFGRLTANGQVFLINPNGVLFGRSAEVNTGGLVASTLNIRNADFMNGVLKFQSDGGNGSVVNQGNIKGDFVALLGSRVKNSGAITAGKSAALAAGDAIILSIDNAGLLAVQVEKGAYNSLVANSGVIEADGGRVPLTAQAADSVMGGVVNNTGLLRARAVENRNGEILLLGDMKSGSVHVDGTLDASAPNGGNGGFVETSAAKVQVADTARVTTLSASGKNGQWLIDPDGFTIATTGGDITGAALSSNLGGGGVSIASTSGSGSDGNINVNDTVTWSANKLTLTATHDVNINAVMTAKGTASLDLEPGSGKVNAGLSGSGFYGRVDFFQVDGVTPRSGTGFLTIGGLGYTVITSLGAQNSTTGTDLQGMSGSLAGRYALGSNIDASGTSTWNSGAGFVPVGSSSANPFTGAFDGLGHTISGLTINRPLTDYVGLFGLVGNGTIRNQGLIGGSVAGRSYVAELVGVMPGVSGSISNSYATGSVTGVSTVGGLVGYNTSGAVSNSYATGSVSGSSNGNYIGALAGYNGSESTNSGSISYSYATGLVSGHNEAGLAGYNDSTHGGTLIHNFWDVTTTGISAWCVGGVCTSATGLTTAGMKSYSSFSDAGWSISNAGGSSAVWRIYDGHTYPLLRNFLTPLTLTPAYDGSGAALANIAAYSASGSYDAAKVR